jgi:hypothetical protein
LEEVALLSVKFRLLTSSGEKINDEPTAWGKRENY